MQGEGKWILSFVLELEQKNHSIILLENRQKQLVEQSRSNGRLNVLDKQGYDELFEVSKAVYKRGIG